MYISLSELIHVLKAVTIATSEHLNLLTIFVVSHFLAAINGVLWMEVNYPGFMDSEKVSFSPE